MFERYCNTDVAWFCKLLRCECFARNRCLLIIFLTLCHRTTFESAAIFHRFDSVNKSQTEIRDALKISVICSTSNVLLSINPLSFLVSPNQFKFQLSSLLGLAACNSVSFLIQFVLRQLSVLMASIRLKSSISDGFVTGFR